MSAIASLERDALDAVEPRLANEGYRLVRSPSSTDLPEFLRSALPDAIALGGPPNLLIEVLVKSGSANVKSDSQRIQRLQDFLSGHPDWRLEVIYARSSTPPLEGASAEQIRRRYEEVRKLATTEPSGALILAWSLLEAVARALEPQRAQRALTPGAMIELLISSGYASETDGDALRSTGRLRNAIAHGDLSKPPPTAGEVQGVLDLVERLAGLLIGRKPAKVQGSAQTPALAGKPR